MLRLKTSNLFQRAYKGFFILMWDRGHDINVYIIYPRIAYDIIGVKKSFKIMDPPQSFKFFIICRLKPYAYPVYPAGYIVSYLVIHRCSGIDLYRDLRVIIYRNIRRDPLKDKPYIRRRNGAWGSASDIYGNELP